MDDRQQAGGPFNWSPVWTTPAATKRKLEYDSWEERAFAEDAAGLLGSGCVWPPRSYTCTFCRREFRSAQALGGHMNVHRRDRARLKQSPNAPLDGQTRGGGGGGVGFLDPPSLVKVAHHKNPNPNFMFYSSSSSNGGGKSPMLSAPLVGPIKEMQGSNFAPPPLFRREKGDAKVIEVECRDQECAKSELSISLSLVVRRNRPEEEASCFKRRKLVAASPDPSPPLIFLSEAGGLREIDLELRLGG